MAWRRNKETSNAAFLDLTSDVCLHVRREEVISNARTNWELLRCQTKYLTGRAPSVLSDSSLKLESDFVLTSAAKAERGCVKVPALADKKVKRTSSQDSQNTSSSNTSSNDFFRLPPILVPIISKMEQKSNLTGAKEARISDSLTSIGPNVDSSFSSLVSSSSDSEECSSCAEDAKNAAAIVQNVEVPAPLPEKQEENKPPSSETNSDISVNTTRTNTSSSGNSNSKFRRSARIIRSATNLKAAQARQVHSRAVTAKPKKQISPTVAPVNKDREQGNLPCFMSPNN